VSLVKLVQRDVARMTVFVKKFFVKGLDRVFLQITIEWFVRSVGCQQCAQTFVVLNVDPLNMGNWRNKFVGVRIIATGVECPPDVKIANRSRDPLLRTFGSWLETDLKVIFKQIEKLKSGQKDPILASSL
jgi:hypothetical protein